MVREDKLIATNRRASYEYFLSSPIECGIVLTGTEIKSLRKHSCSLQDAYVIIKGHEAFILGMHIAPYEQGTIYNHAETRTRKLLLHKKEILKWYRRLSEEFASLPFDEAVAHCRDMAKKYYSCYPFLLQIGALLVNYSSLAGSPGKSEQVINEALDLFRRVKTESEDPVHAREALQMEAYCLLALEHPIRVDIQRLDDTTRRITIEGVTL